MEIFGWFVFTAIVVCLTCAGVLALLLGNTDQGPARWYWWPPVLCGIVVLWWAMVESSPFTFVMAP